MQIIDENKITFIIPSVNRETLTNSVNSLINQTNGNWKCIIIYDGVTGIEFEDERIKCIEINKLGNNTSSHGVSGLVRDIGLDLVDTGWIGFLDDDDSLEPEYVETLFNKYTDYDFVIFRMMWENGRVFPSGESLYFGNVGISFCYKNKFEGLRFGRNDDGEDFEFITKLTNLTKNYIITPEILYRVNH
jgi:glycosyltransferase involved in cell wall biosynthesis